MMSPEIFTKPATELFYKVIMCLLLFIQLQDSQLPLLLRAEQAHLWLESVRLAYVIASLRYFPWRWKMKGNGK